MSKSIPDRWLDYEPVGRQIKNTPFVAFKVPLKDELCNSLPPEGHFTPTNLLERLPNLSLIIDLTNTKRYYNDRIFLENGVKYKKLMCPGHEIPPLRLVQEFFATVDAFLQENTEPVRLIGVHCTHGINRTGYFICSYMINKLGYNCESAVSEFNAARGHNIERQNYVNALKRFDTNPINFDFAKTNRRNAPFDRRIYESSPLQYGLHPQYRGSPRAASPHIQRVWNPYQAENQSVYRPRFSENQNSSYRLHFSENQHGSYRPRYSENQRSFYRPRPPGAFKIEPRYPEHQSASYRANLNYADNQRAGHFGNRYPTGQPTTRQSYIPNRRFTGPRLGACFPQTNSFNKN